MTASDICAFPYLPIKRFFFLLRSMHFIFVVSNVRSRAKGRRLRKSDNWCNSFHRGNDRQDYEMQVAWNFLRFDANFCKTVR